MDDEIVELLFNDLRITGDDIKQYSITSYAPFKQEAASTSLGIEAIIFYESKYTEDIQDCKMDEIEGDEVER